MVEVVIHLKHQTRTANLSGDLRGSFVDEEAKVAFLEELRNGRMRLQVELLPSESNATKEFFKAWWELTQPT